MDEPCGIGRATLALAQVPPDGPLPAGRVVLVLGGEGDRSGQHHELKSNQIDIRKFRNMKHTLHHELEVS
jgi:hypothetical protein